MRRSFASDMFPQRTVGSVVGTGGFAGAMGCSGCMARDSSVPKVTLVLDDNDVFYPIPQAAITVNPNFT